MNPLKAGVKAGKKSPFSKSLSQRFHTTAARAGSIKGKPYKFASKSVQRANASKGGM